MVRSAGDCGAWLSQDSHVAACPGRRASKSSRPLASQRGRRRCWPSREIVEAIFYLLRAGCPWRLLPDSFPPWRTVYQRLCTLPDAGVVESIIHHLVRLDRIRTGREPTQSDAVLERQQRDEGRRG